MTATFAFQRVPSRPAAAPRRVARQRPSSAVYRRRRLVVGALFAAIVTSGGMAAADVLAGPGSETASAAGSQPTLERAVVVAHPGDTLWSIAQQHHGEVPLQRYVDRLVNLNGGAAIQAGQGVVLP